MNYSWIEWGGRQMRHGGGRARRLGALALLALVCGCTTAPSTSEPSPPPTGATSPESPMTSSPADPKVAVAEAVAAYRGMWAAFNTAMSIPDPELPDLRRYATANALTSLTVGVRSTKDRGLKGTGTFVVSPNVTEITPVGDPAKIGIRDCVDTSRSRLVRAVPGPSYSDSPGGRRLCLAEVQRQPDGSWKVTGFGLRAVGTCT